MTEQIGAVKRQYIVDRQARRKRMKLVAEAIELLNELRKIDGLKERQLKQLLDYMDELKALHVVDRGERDMLYFTYEMFSEDRNPENQGNLIPEGVSIEDAPNFHIELTDILNVVSNDHINKKIAYSAPRGHAKSAYLSNSFPLHECVYGKRHYILVISESEAAAKKFVEWISNELKFNAKLRYYYGELLSPNKGSNDRDNQEAFLTNTGTLVEAASIGKQLRGE